MIKELIKKLKIEKFTKRSVFNGNVVIPLDEYKKGLDAFINNLEHIELINKNLLKTIKNKKSERRVMHDGHLEFNSIDYNIFINKCINDLMEIV